jgi:uncharacterized YccA/Bax inhibitor family protein
MRSNNPVFSRNEEFARSGYGGLQSAPDTVTAGQLQDMYDRPAATPQQTGRMTIDDVVMRTAILFAILLVFAAGAWVLGVGFGVAIVAALAAFGVAMFVSFRREISPALTMVYAALEGIFIGAISRAYETAWSGVVPQAVLGTLAAFVGMLILYRSGKLRATPKFTKVLITATFGYVIVALISLVTAFFGVGDGWGFYGVSGLGILLCVAGVALASLFLILDFDFVEQGMRNGLPEREAWRAAFGLMVTLVWLYLELLRLLAILRGD